jgi:hypothetical protein
VANAGANARLTASRIRTPKMIWMEVFIGDKGKKTEEDRAALNSPSILF